MRVSRARRITLSLAVAVSLALSALPAAAAGPTIALPDTMAAVGDSITRAASTGGSLGADAPHNSWSTGTSASVSSHHARLVGLGAPLSQATTHNLAVSGARVVDLPGQMANAAAVQPDYLTVLIGGNDVCTSTESGMTSVADYQAHFQAAMTTISTSSPDTHVYVVSIPRVLGLWELFRNNWWARIVWSAGKVCQSLLANPTSTQQTDVGRRARVDQRNRDFNAVMATICAATPRCHWDGNAAYNTSFVASDVSGDYFHPSAQGQAKLASVSWAAGYTWNIPPGSEPQVRIGGLTGSGANSSSRYWRATVTITATKPDGAAVAGATVSGSFSAGGGTKSCTTAASGSCSVTSNSLSRSGVASTTYTVGSVSHATHAYVPGQNAASSVVVTRP